MPWATPSWEVPRHSRTTAWNRGLLAINHEATTDERSSFFLHTTGGTATLPRPAAEVDKEVAIHGSVVEVKKTADRSAYVKDSACNVRLTPLTDIQMAGPVREKTPWVTLRTKARPSACPQPASPANRLAADAVGATKMDRPEWCAVNPANGEI